MDPNADAKSKKPGRSKAKASDTDRRDDQPTATGVIVSDGTGASVAGEISGGEVSGLNVNTPSKSAADGGAGELGAGSLGGQAAGEFIDRLSLDQIHDALTAEQLAFRKAYPNFSAAIDAWMEKGGGEPAGLRVIAKRDGFRRAGVAHTKAPAEHPFEAFPSPELLEALFSEPMLKVELV